MHLDDSPSKQTACCRCVSRVLGALDAVDAACACNQPLQACAVRLCRTCMMADRIALQWREGGVGAALLEVAAAPQNRDDNGGVSTCLPCHGRCVDIFWWIEKRPHNLNLQLQRNARSPVSFVRCPGVFLQLSAE